MSSLCCDSDCGCTGFTQSMFTGYTNAECSTCRHDRHEHISYGPATFGIQIAKWYSNPRNTEMVLKVLRILAGRHKMESRRSWFSRRKLENPSYLAMLPSDLLGVVANYLATPWTISSPSVSIDKTTPMEWDGMVGPNG